MYCPREWRTYLCNVRYTNTYGSLGKFKGLFSSSRFLTVPALYSVDCSPLNLTIIILLICFSDVMLQCKKINEDADRAIHNATQALWNS